MGFEPMNTGFADQRVNHFAIGAYTLRTSNLRRAQRCNCCRHTAIVADAYFGCAVVRKYGFTVL
jgi:hypothetical protein